MEKTIYNHLKNLIHHHDNYFEDELAQYLINRLDNDTLKNQTIFIQHKTPYHIDGNLWSYINLEYKEWCYKKMETGSLSQETLQKYEKHYHLWKNIIEKKSLDLIEAPVFKLSKNNKKYDVSINFFLALDDMYAWHLLKSKNSSYEMNSTEEKLLIEHILDKNFNVTIYGKHLENQDFQQWLIHIFNAYLGKYQKEQRKTDEEIISKLLDSENTKTILKSIDMSQIAKCFSDESLKKILHKTSQSSNLFMLSYFLPIATPEHWKAILKKDTQDKFDFISLILPIVAKAIDLSTKELNELIIKGNQFVKSKISQQKSITATKELYKIFDYFKNVIDWDEELQTKWYTIVVLIQDDNLYDLSRSIINPPEWYSESNLKNPSHIIHTNDFKYAETWLKCKESLYQAEQLEQTLEKNQNIIKKHKL